MKTPIVASSKFNKANAYLPKAKVCKPPPPPGPAPPPGSPTCSFQFDPDIISVNDATSAWWLACHPDLDLGDDVDVSIELPEGCSWTEEPQADNCVRGGESLITGDTWGDFLVEAVFTFSNSHVCRASAWLHIVPEPDEP